VVPSVGKSDPSTMLPSTMLKLTFVVCDAGAVHVLLRRLERSPPSCRREVLLLWASTPPPCMITRFPIDGVTPHRECRNATEKHKLKPGAPVLRGTVISRAGGQCRGQPCARSGPHGGRDELRELRRHEPEARSTCNGTPTMTRIELRTSGRQAGARSGATTSPCCFAYLARCHIHLHFTTSVPLSAA
jgi:hypothetical protein